MTRKFCLLRNKNAFSQMIGSLMIFLIVTILLVSVFAWASSTINSNQDNFSSIIGLKQKAIKERFIVEYILFTDTVGNPGDHKNVTLYIRNVGDSELEIGSIYINGTPSSAVNPSLPQILLSDQVNQFSITLANSWNSNSANHIIVVSEKGNRIQGYWQAY